MCEEPAILINKRCVKLHPDTPNTTDLVAKGAYCRKYNSTDKKCEECYDSSHYISNFGYCCPLNSSPDLETGACKVHSASFGIQNCLKTTVALKDGFGYDYTCT